MKPNLLFPSFFKIIGVILLIPGLVLWYLYCFRYYKIPFLSYGPDNPFGGNNNLTDELFNTLILLGLIFIGFSKLINESDLTVRLRLKASYWAVLLNCCLGAISLIYSILSDLLKIPFFKNHDLPAYYCFYNQFILLFIFLIRLYYLLYREKKGKLIKPLYYFPHKPYHIIGKTVTLLFIFFSIASLIPFFKINSNSDAYSAVFILALLFVLLWIWSKEKNENEAIAEIRLKATQIAIYINYSLFLISTWAIYGSDYLYVFVIGLVSVQLIFIIVFYYLRFKVLKAAPHSILV